ncbi:M20/M25/M40 family metallo-hydrolase [Aurantiacibacter spongiae]|uniref:Carboxypeptidase Q n=1 Tax=Aurantiacibacter spongiae TaxID=2488860 RepID=A0A3N5DCA3_9SPHN|nr:M20/M25/M40 family metallo-hydrolase [Aurantiacibacter spongiae]RPF72418.1 M20/M25/M40 family metallo-hydrolase [Aurantiacibacter spongiae]
MKKTLLALTALSLAAPATAQRYDLEPGAHDPIAWDFVEGISTEVGPRLAGTPDEARGRAWAMEWLRANGFANVVEEPFMHDTWVRGEETARIVSPYPQPIVLTALGRSGSTGEGGLIAEVVRFDDMAELEAAPAGSLAGKIAFIDHAMRATMDGSHYGYFGQARRRGPAIAASKGAAGVVIRSIGSDTDRLPHTGGTGWDEGQEPIPAAALSNPDADNLTRMLERGQPVTLEMTLTPRFVGMTPSGNVTGEIVGRDPSLPPVLLACHLDSWDLGTGALDDGVGCAVAAAAARRVAEAGRPLRTIRVLFAGSEETGLYGSTAYSEAHADEPIAAGIESDTGMGLIWEMSSNFTDTNPDLYQRMLRAVDGYGVGPSTDVAAGGADLNVVRDQGGAIIELQQDISDYFGIHHTANDTLDKVDPAILAQNVAVWAALVNVLANEAGPIKPAE